jgi:hypothetical protein
VRIYDWNRIDEREAIALDIIPFSSSFLLDFFVETEANAIYVT